MEKTYGKMRGSGLLYRTQYDGKVGLDEYNI